MRITRTILAILIFLGGFACILLWGFKDGIPNSALLLGIFLMLIAEPIGGD